MKNILIIIGIIAMSKCSYSNIQVGQCYRLQELTDRKTFVSADTVVLTHSTILYEFMGGLEYLIPKKEEDSIRLMVFEYKSNCIKTLIWAREKENMMEIVNKLRWDTTRVQY